ncbi:MAG: UvrD-helicase domain-containing protein [Huintestinicola sp.]
MAEKWTEQQLEAIGAKDHAVIVSAAAGSGKTAVLIEKLLRILSDREKPVPADRIAVATFTNDAAAQMKQRLSDALAKAAEEDPSNEWLISQQSLVQGAKISTISSFCFNLIRENISLTDLDGGFRIIEPAEEDIIVSQAIKNAMENRIEAGGQAAEELAKLSRFFFPSARNAQGFSGFIAELRSNILSVPFCGRFMQECIDFYASPVDPDNDPLIKVYLDDIHSKLISVMYSVEQAHALAVDAYSLIPSSDPKENAKIADSIGVFERDYTFYDKNGDPVLSDADIVRRAAGLCSEPRKFFDSPISNTDFMRLCSYNPYSRKKNLSDAELKQKAELEVRLQRYKDVRERYKKEYSSLCTGITLDNIREDYKVHADICRMLFSFLNEVIAEEKRIKAEKNVLGFSDAEQTAASLLCRMKDGGTIEKTELARELSQRYAIVMMDEFQDSNGIQELIFRLLSHNGEADKAGDNFFAVGDIKQSIYRFRNADPEIFRKNLTCSVPYAGAKEGESTYILLNRNFRSSKGVIDFVNTVFGVIMSKQCGGLDYGTEDMLIKGSDTDYPGCTEIISIPPADSIEELSRKDAAEDGDNDSDDEDEDEELTSDDAAEARITAQRIRRLLDEETITVNGTVRRCQPSDICILMRKTEKASVFAAELEALGIPAGGDSAESYLASREISVLSNLLRAADNPTLDIPMTSVLMSPMFMFTADDAARLRTIGKSSVYADITEVCDNAGDYPFEFAEKCRGFIKVFGEIRRFAAANSTESLIRYIYDKTDFLSVVSVLKDSAKRKANLRLLPIYAADYDRNGGGGLSGFVRRLNAMTENGKDFAAASAVTESSGGKVAIKTIHKSKGLEYPFVFLCQLHTGFNTKSLKQKFMFNSRFGAAFDITDIKNSAAYISFPRAAFKALKRRADRDEEMMLFYVAMTRAKLKLFITRQNGRKAVEAREKARSLYDVGSIKQDISAGAASSMDMWLETALCSFTQADETHMVNKECTVEITKGTLMDRTDAESSADGVNAEGTASVGYDTKALEEEFSRRIAAGRAYDLTPSKTAAKLTVSEIAKKHAPETGIIGRRVGRLPRGISASEAGTAVHAFMQYADLDAIADSAEMENAIRSEAERLASKTILTDTQAECADPGLITPFFDTDLYRRMRISGEILKEKKFLVKISELSLDDSDLLVYNNSEGMLQGVADCLFREKDGWVLLDYKTDRNVTEEGLRQRYSRQLKLYARALSLILDIPVKEAYLYSFTLRKAIATEI